MKKLIATVLTLIASLAVASTASARIPPLHFVQARNIAANVALNQWNPNTLLPSYSLATSWDGVNSNNCIWFDNYDTHCVVSVNAQDYYYDPIAEMQTGYAYCNGTVYVSKNRHSGRIRTSTHELSCDSTDDTQNSNGFDLAP
jgi:hypothetical protein